MSRNYELLRLLHREHELFQRALPPDASNVRENEVSRLTEIERRLFEDAAPSTGALAAPASQQAAGLARGETCKLVQRLFLGASSTAPRAVVFSPVEQNKEHHWIAAQVAELLASHTQESICLVDTNLANPSLHEYFGVENHCGVAGTPLGFRPPLKFFKTLPPAPARLSCAVPRTERRRLRTAPAFRGAHWTEY